ncbi:MAG: ATP-binding protein [Christensenellales bacterium]
MEPVLKETSHVSRGDFTSAGNVSANFKRKVKQLGVDSKLARQISIAAYESELNLVIHSNGGEMTLEVYSDRIVLKSEDCGPGIPDIDLAMQEGWSTAPENIRAMGFGAGMGLPNMKRQSDRFAITSSPAGTSIVMEFVLQKPE